jgi:hypothetical protein
VGDHCRLGRWSQDRSSWDRSSQDRSSRRKRIVRVFGLSACHARRRLGVRNRQPWNGIHFRRWLRHRGIHAEGRISGNDHRCTTDVGAAAPCPSGLSRACWCPDQSEAHSQKGAAHEGSFPGSCILARAGE